MAGNPAPNESLAAELSPAEYREDLYARAVDVVRAFARARNGADAVRVNCRRLTNLQRCAEFAGGATHSRAPELLDRLGELVLLLPSETAVPSRLLYEELDRTLEHRGGPVLDLANGMGWRDAAA